LASWEFLLQKVSSQDGSGGQIGPSVRGSLTEEHDRLVGVSGGMSFLFNGQDLTDDALTYEVVDRHVADDLVIEFGRLICTKKLPSRDDC